MSTTHVRKKTAGSLLATAAALVVLALVPGGAEAATTGSGTSVAPTEIRASSAQVTVFGIRLTTDTVDKLTNARVDFENVDGNFTTADLAGDAGGTASDGVQLWRDDSRAGGNDDTLDGGDTAVSTGFAFNNNCAGAAGTTCQADLALTDETLGIALPTAAEGSYEFLLAVRTSSTASNGDEFEVTLPSNAFTTVLASTTIAAVSTPTITILRTTIALTDLAPGAVQVESSQVTAFGVKMVTPASLPDTLTGAAVSFVNENGSFTTSDLRLNGSGTDEDGVQLWKDTSVSGGNADALDSGDTAVSSGFTFDDDCSGGVGAVCTATFTLVDSTIPTSEPGDYNYFVVFRTSASIGAADEFSILLQNNSFTTSPTATTTPMTSTGVIQVDGTAPSAPVVTDLGLSVAAGKVRVGATAVGSETAGFLEVWRATEASCIDSETNTLTKVSESSQVDLTVTDSDLVGTTAAQTSALQGGFPAGNYVCYRVRDEAGNRSGFVLDGSIPAAPAAGETDLLGASNVDGLKRIYAETATTARTYRAYLRPGGSGIVRAESESGAFVEITTSTSGGTNSGTTNITQFGGGATMAAGDGVAYTRLDASSGNEGAATDDGTIPAAPVVGDASLLSTSAADGHRRILSDADSSPGRIFGLYVGPSGSRTRAVTTSGGAAPVRVTTASGAADSGTSSIFAGAGGTTALAAGDAVAYVGVNSAGNESGATDDGTIPAAPVAGDIVFSDALNQFTVDPFPSGVSVRLWVGDPGDTAGDAYDGTADGEATSTTPVSVGEFGPGPLYYTAASTANGNESPTAADGSIPAAPGSADTALLSVTAVSGGQKVRAATDAAGPRTFRLYSDPAGGTTWSRAASGTNPVEVVTSTSGATDSGTTAITVSGDPLAAGFSVGHALLVAGNDSDPAADGAIPAAPSAAGGSVSDALDEFRHTGATAASNVNLFLGGYDGSPEGTATSGSTVSISDPAAASVDYTTTQTSSGNESALTGDGSVPAAPAASEAGLLEASAAQGHQRVSASTDAGGPRTYRLYVDPSGAPAAWTRAATSSGGSTPVEVTTSTGGATDSATAEVFAGTGATTPLAGGDDVAYAAANSNGHDSDVLADGSIPAAPNAGQASASAADDTVESAQGGVAGTVRVYASTSSSASTAYGEGVDASLTTTGPAALDTSAGDRLYYTIYETTNGNESSITADGQIPAAPAALDGTVSDALDQFTAASATASYEVNLFFGSYDGTPDATATGSAPIAIGDPAAGAAVNYTATDAASDNESPVTADGAVPGAPTSVPSVMSASAAEQRIRANPDDIARVIRLYLTPSGGSLTRAATTAGGSAPVEIMTSTEASSVSGVGIFRGGSEMTADDAVSYARVGDGHDSDVVADGTIPTAPTGPEHFSIDASAGTATVAAGQLSGTYRAFRSTSAISPRATHTNGTATGITLSTTPDPGDAVGWARTVSGNESPTLSDGTIPDISNPDLQAASDTGSSSTDNVTSDTTPALDVTTDPGLSVEFFRDDVSVGSEMADGSGLATFTSAALSDGTYAFHAKITGAGGNTALSGDLTVTIDTLAPNVPDTPDLQAASDSGSSSTDDITSDTTPTIDVAGAETGSTVTLYEGDTATALGTGTASSTASITTSALSAGAHTIKATATDLAGNESDPRTAALNLTIDTAAPSVGTPDLTAASDTGSSSTDNVTNDNTPTFTIAAETGSTVTLKEGATTRGSATSSGGSATITSSALSNGAHSISAQATDVAGNSATSGALSVTIDTAAPSVGTPDLAAASDSGSSSTDNVTNDSTPAFTVAAETGSTVALKEGATTLGSATSSGGSASVTSSALADGGHNVSAQATDAAGNSSTSSALGVTIDTTAPTGVRMTGPAMSRRFQTARRFNVAWTATDAGSGVDHFDLKLRGAVWNGNFGSFVNWLTDTSATNANFTGSRGRTYGFVPTAVDEAGNSATGAEKFTSVPLNNTNMAHSSGWAKKSGSGFYENTYSVTSTRGARLVRTDAKARRLAVVYTKCNGCGEIEIYFRGVLVKRINTDASGWKKRQVTEVALPSTKTGTVVVRNRDGDRTFVEGVGIGRV